jgi:MFS transporter, DHA1 family, solute carrier family 18 (vesicular amine transporter), member 1/2
MLRYTSKDGTELTMRYSRSLSRYSESYLHVQTDVPNKYNKFVLFIVFLAFLLDSLLLSLGITIFPDYLEAIYGVPGICVLFSIPPFVMTLATPFATHTVDHKGPKTPLLYGILLSLVATSLFAYALSLHDHKPAGYGLILFALSVHGLASAFITRGGISLVTMSHTDATRGTAFRIVLSGAALGLICGPLIGGVLYLISNAYTPYLLLAVLFAIVLLFLLPIYNGGHSVLVSEVDDGEDMRLHLLPIDGAVYSGELSALDCAALSDLIRNKHMLIVIGACVVGSTAVGIMAPLLPTFMRQTLGLSAAGQGAVFALLPLAAFLFSPVVASVSDLTSSYATTRSMAEGGPSSPRYNAMFAGITIIGMALCCVVWVTNLGVLCVVLVAVGVGQTCLQTPCMPLIADIAEVPSYVQMPCSTPCHVCLSTFTIECAP